MNEERRRYKRITIGFDADINYNGSSYTGVIENLSETGVCVLTNPIDTKVEFITGETLELIFEPRPGEAFRLQCYIQWAYKIEPHLVINRIGLEIIDPPWKKSGFFI